MLLSNNMNSFNSDITNNKLNQIIQQPLLESIRTHNNDDYINDIIKLSDNKSSFLLKDNIHQKITRMNIDSRNRIKYPKNILSSNLIYLLSNPLSFNKDSKDIKIQCNKKHHLELDYKIILQNVTSKIFQIKGNLNILKNNYYIKITYVDHGITEDEFKYNKQQILLSGITGTSRNNSYIGNVPISILNKIHYIYLISDVDLAGSKDYFFIKINILPNISYNDINSNIKIYFKNIAGIPINIINSNYPININQINGFLTVSKIENEYTFYVEIDHPAAITLSNTGGNGIYFSKIENYIEGYPDPNHYKIILSKSLHNIRQIKLVSSEFPNTEKVIKNYPESKKNNKIYWQNLDDGEHIYSLEITPGNYNPTSLITEIKEKFEKTKRINYTDTLIINDGINAKLEKGEYHNVDIIINGYTDVVEFKSYNVVILEKAISKSENEYDDGHIRIIINHVNHGLFAGDSIVIENTISSNSIPSTVINTSHIIDSIQDEHNYLIKLTIHNESKTTDNTGGGIAIYVLIPIKFRIFFNYSDTPGYLLGFRHVGESNAITSFEYTIANNIAYEEDFFQDSVGKDILFDELTREVQNNVLSLSGDNYFIMSCDIFKDNESLSSNNIPNVFTKILLSDNPGTVLYNQHIQLAEYLNSPIINLNSMEFKFYSPSGELFDFNGIEHSFTLEFYEDQISMANQNVSSKTGLPQRTDYSTYVKSTEDIDDFDKGKGKGNNYSEN